jgi:hypothetical protein
MKTIVIMDFDGTLIDSPIDVDGREFWKEKTGDEFPHKGWWGKKESLSLEVFDIQPIGKVLVDYNKHIENGDTIYLVTGRIPKLGDEVRAILDKHKLTFSKGVVSKDPFKELEAPSDGVYLRRSGKDTADFKIKLFTNMVEAEKPDKFVIYEDRFDHVKVFKDWSRTLDIPVVINFV